MKSWAPLIQQFFSIMIILLSLYSTNTLSFSLKESGKSFWFTLASVSKIFEASSSFPVARSHLGDSGKNLKNKCRQSKVVAFCVSHHQTYTHKVYINLINYKSCSSVGIFIRINLLIVLISIRALNRTQLCRSQLISWFVVNSSLHHLIHIHYLVK